MPSTYKILTAGRWLLFAAVLTPLVVAPGVYFPFIVPRAVAFRILVGAALALVAVLVFVRRPIPRSGRDPFLLALGVWVLVSFLTSLVGASPSRSLFGELQRMWGVTTWFYFLAYYVLLRVCMRDRDWVPLLRLVLIVAVLAGGYAVAQYHAIELPLELYHVGRGRAAALSGNPGFLAALLMLSIGVAAYLCASSGARARWIYAACATALLYPLALSGTRTAAASLALGATAAALIWALQSGKGAAWRRVAFGASALAVIVVGTLLWGPADNPLLARLGAFGAADQNLLARLELWRAGWAAFLQRPLLGWGPENFAVAFSQAFRPESYDIFSNSTYPDRAHNGYLEAAVAGGLLGLAAFLALWAALFWNLVRALRCSRLTTAGFAVLAGTLVALMAHLLLWFEDHGAILVLMVLAAFISQRAAGAPLLDFEPRAERHASRALMAAAAVAILALFTYQHSLRVFEAARTAQQARGVVESDVERQLAAAFSTTGGSEDPARELVRNRLNLYLEASDPGVPEARDVVRLLVEHLQELAPTLQAARRDPEWHELIASTVERADQRLSLATAADPLNDGWYLERIGLMTFALAFLQDARFYEAAQQDIAAALSLSPNRIRYYHLLANLHLMANRPDLAHRALDRAESIYAEFGETNAFRATTFVVEGRPLAAYSQMRVAYEKGFWEDQAARDRVAEALAAAGESATGADLLIAYLETRFAVPPGQAPRPTLRLGEADREVAARALELAAAASGADLRRRAAEWVALPG